MVLADMRVFCWSSSGWKCKVPLQDTNDNISLNNNAIGHNHHCILIGCSPIANDKLATTLLAHLGRSLKLQNSLFVFSSAHIVFAYMRRFGGMPVEENSTHQREDHLSYNIKSSQFSCLRLVLLVVSHEVLFLKSSSSTR